MAAPKKKSRKIFFLQNKKKMKFCKKCHRRVLTTETFGGSLNYVLESDKFCRCHISVVADDNGPKTLVQFKKRRGGACG